MIILTHFGATTWLANTALCDQLDPERLAKLYRERSITYRVLRPFAQHILDWLLILAVARTLEWDFPTSILACSIPLASRAMMYVAALDGSATRARNWFIFTGVLICCVGYIPALFAAKLIGK